MSTILVIAGHGKNRDGSFDPGATGFISKGEHKYYVEDFFPSVRKYLPANSNVVLFDEYNVYSYGNLASLAKSYGKDTVVIECHYDATGSTEASGGHVIVHKDYSPDKLDLAIRDVIKKHIGIRHNHRNHAGISGRDNLANCNIARSNGINYRLIELGFGTNKNDADTMVKNVDAIAKDFVQSICGTSAISPVPTKPTTPTVSGAKSYKLVTTVNGYINAGDAKNKKNAKTKVKAGNYTVFSEANGMINVTSKAGIPGSWINPSDNKAPVSVPKPSAPNQSGIVKSYKEEGIFYTDPRPDDRIYVRDQPSTKGKIVAEYYIYGVNESLPVEYHTVHLGNGYVWLQYDRKRDGKVIGQGYIPCREYVNGKYGALWGTIK